jgi:hypothetical protein
MLLIHRAAIFFFEVASPGQIAPNALLWPTTCRLVSTVSAVLALMTRNDLHAVSAGPLISKPPVAQPVSRNPLDTIASLVCLASICLASFLNARTLSRNATLFCLSQPAPVPGDDHCQEADSEANFEPVRRKHEARAG